MADPDMAAFSAKMKQYRKRANLSLENVAKAAGMMEIVMRERHFKAHPEAIITKDNL